MKLIPLVAVGYSHGILPTVTIIRDGQYVRINLSDYDEKTMELVEPIVSAEPEQTAAPAPEPIVSAEPEQTAAPAPEPIVSAEPEQTAAPTPQQLIVMKSGRKFFVADMMGQKVEGEAAVALGISDAGYATEAEAQATLAGIASQG